MRLEGRRWLVVNGGVIGVVGGLELRLVELELRLGGVKLVDKGLIGGVWRGLGMM